MALIYDKALYDAQYSVRAWEHGVRDQPRVPRHHYNWFVNTQGPNARLRKVAQRFINHPSWNQITDIAIIGGGFGWTAEILLELDPTINIINVETSPHVINTLATSEEADLRGYLTDDGFDPDNIDFLMHPDQSRTLTNAEVWATWLRPDGVRSAITTLDNDLSTNGQRRDVRQALGNNIDALITEVALDSHTNDPEIENFLDVVEQTRPNPGCTVIHYIEYQAGMDVAWGYISKPIAEWATYLDTRGYSDHWLMDTLGNVQRADGATI